MSRRICHLLFKKGQNSEVAEAIRLVIEIVLTITPYTVSLSCINTGQQLFELESGQSKFAIVIDRLPLRACFVVKV